MHHLPLRAALHAFLLMGIVAATGGDIALSSFTPRIDNLPSQCKSVYNSKIDGCTPSDFAGNPCSQSCLRGLAQIGDAVKKSCSSVDVGETSIIGVFQNDIGIAALCPNNRNSPSTTAESSTAAQTSTRASSTDTSTRTSTSSSSSTAPTSKSSTASSRRPTESNASTVTFATPTETTAPSPTTDASERGNTQLSNADSGGGSPFDVVATGSGSQLRHATLGMVVAVLLAAAGVQV
jgi:hypothetical protein